LKQTSPIETVSPASFFFELVSMMVGQADQQHLLALLGHHVAEVGEREALADAALAVDRDDLRGLGGGRGADRIGFDRGFGLQAFVTHEDDRGRAWAHGQCLQSRTIFRQPASPKAVR
jgi:hypothetical protein